MISLSWGVAIAIIILIIAFLVGSYLFYKEKILFALGEDLKYKSIPDIKSLYLDTFATYPGIFKAAKPIIFAHSPGLLAEFEQDVEATKQLHQEKIDSEDL